MQSALFSLREAAIIAKQTPIGQEIGQLLLETERQISNGLVDALRLQGAALPPAKAKFDLFDMVSGLAADLESIARQRDIQIRIASGPGDSCAVFGVPFHIRVAFSNLLDNAIKYSFEGKWIDVRFLRVPAGGKTSSRSRGQISVEIEDIGVGFPTEMKDELFNFGIRLDETPGKWARSGAGIGLAQAKEYLESAGGSLDIDSEQLPTKSDRAGSIARVTAVVHLPIA